MNLIELADKRDQKIKALENYINNLKAEQRKMDENENSEFIKLKNEVEEINKQIDEIRKADEAEKVEINTKKNKRNMNTNFSLLKTIRDIVDNRPLSDEAREFINLGKETFNKAGLGHRGQIVIPTEYRAGVLAGTATDGQEVVAEEKMSLLGPLYAKTLFGQLGVTMYNNLVGDVSIPVYAGTTSLWKTEVEAAGDGVGEFSEVTLSPNRLTTYIDISKQFLAQDGINAEASLMNDLAKSILVKVENTAFGATSGTTGLMPAGLFYNADYSGTLSGATSWDKLIGIRAAVDASNALEGNLAYITTPALGAIFETKSTDTGSGVFCMSNGKIGGYPVYTSSNVNAGKIAFGNWADYVVGQWGGMDITVDPYTQAINGKVRIVVNTFWDFKVRRSASFKLSQLS